MDKNVKRGFMMPDESFGKEGKQTARLTMHPEIRKGKSLNLGCGFTKFLGPDWINTDKYDICNPDVVHDLEVKPYPWPNDTFDYIFANHVFEHIEDWWGAFLECSRILKVGGYLEIRVPDESSSSAMTYRDHRHIFHFLSFHGVGKRGSKTLYRSGTNAWAKTIEGTVPLEMKWYHKVPHKEYAWMSHWPFRYLLAFCAGHLRNFIWEQQFIFHKFSDRGE